MVARSGGRQLGLCLDNEASVARRQLVWRGAGRRGKGPRIRARCAIRRSARLTGNHEAVIGEDERSWSFVSRSALSHGRAASRAAIRYERKRDVRMRLKRSRARDRRRVGTASAIVLTQWIWTTTRRGGMTRARRLERGPQAAELAPRTESTKSV